jgi:hypothetical protein
MTETTTSNLIRTPFGFHSTSAEVIEGIELSGERAAAVTATTGNPDVHVGRLDLADQASVADRADQERGADYASRGIRVNAVCLGLVNTPLIAEMASQSPEMHDSLVAAHHPARSRRRQRSPMRSFGSARRSRIT